MKTLFILQNEGVDIPCWAEHECDVVEEKDGYLHFKMPDGTVKRIKSGFVSGTWQTRPINAFFFADGYQARSFRVYLNDRAWLHSYIPKVKEIALYGGAFQEPWNYQAILPEINRYCVAMEERNYPMLVEPAAMRKCIRLFNLDRSSFPNLYTDAIAVAISDIQLLDKLASIDDSMSPRQKGALRRSYLHALLVDAYDNLEQS